MLTGGIGKDTLKGGSGGNKFVGSGDDDTYVIHDSAAGTDEIAGTDAGTDTIDLTQISAASLLISLIICVW